MNKRRKTSLSILFGAMTVLTLSSGAAEYYLNPAGGSMSNPGTAAEPWPALEAVAAAGRTFAAGDVLILMAGHHGSPTLVNANVGYVTVRPQTGARATLKNLAFGSAARFWRVQGLVISPETAPTFTRVTLIDMNTAADTIIEDCLACSVENSRGWTADDWEAKACNGLSLDGSRNIVRRNTFKNVNFGISVGGGQNLIQHNTVEFFNGDGMRAFDNNTLEYNLVKNNISTNDNHDDGFQSWSYGPGGVGTGVVRNVVLRGNVIIQNDDPTLPLRGSYLQGIGCFDGFYEDWVVENNVIMVDHWHGIAFYGARNCKFLNNTVVDINRTGAGPAWLGIFAHKDGTPSTGNLVRNNLVSDLSLSGTGNTVDHNLETTAYETHFVNWAGVDLRLRAGSAAIDAGSADQAPATDARGAARPVDGDGDGTAAWDLGAYEYGNNQPPTITSPAWADANPVTLPAGVTVHVVATDPDGDPLTYAWSQVSGPGTATFAAASAADSGVTFSAAGGYVLRVTVSDDQGASVTSDVSVTVISDVDARADVNHDGVVNALDLQIVIANFGKTVGSPGCDARADANADGVVNALDLQLVIANFGKSVPSNQAPVADAQSVSASAGTAKAIILTGSDPNGDALTYTVLTQPAHGTLAGAAPSLTYTAAGGYVGADSFTFKVSDGALDSAPATVTITVGGDLKGWELNPTNTGLAPHGIIGANLPVYTGPSKIPAGSRISGVRFTGHVDLTLGDIIIEKSLFQPTDLGIGGSVAIATSLINNQWDAPPSKVTIRDCEFDASRIPLENAAKGFAFSGLADLQRNYIHGFGTGISIFGTGRTLDGLIEGNYITDTPAFGDAATTGNHIDAFTIRDFTDAQRPDRKLVVRNNRFDANADINVTGAFFIQAWNGRIDNVSIEGNLLEGNGNNLILETNANGYSNISATDNRFAPTGYGPTYFTGSGWATWQNNYIYNPTQPDGKGAVVNP